MILGKYLDSGRLNFVDVFMRFARNFGDLQFNYKRDLGNELKKDINIISRGHLKSILQKCAKINRQRMMLILKSKRWPRFLYWRLMILLH